MAVGYWRLARFNLSSLFIFLMLTVLMTLAHTHASFNMAIGCWRLAVGCWLLAVGGWLLAFGCWRFERTQTACLTALAGRGSAIKSYGLAWRWLWLWLWLVFANKPTFSFVIPEM